MPTIHVCALATLGETVARTGARSVLTLLSNAERHMEQHLLSLDRHLKLELSDIAEAQVGRIVPGAHHVEAILAFLREWDRKAPLVVHCYAGVSRSTAATLTAACLFAPEIPEAELAARLRNASPTATPNPAIIAHADRALGRNGRMVAAVAALGRGAEVTEHLGTPFHLDLSGTERHGLFFRHG